MISHKGNPNENLQFATEILTTISPSRKMTALSLMTWRWQYGTNELLTLQPQCKDSHSSRDMHENITAFCDLVFWAVNAWKIEKFIGQWRFSTMMHNLLRNQLQHAITSTWCELLSSGVLLQYDNAQPHTAHVTDETIMDPHFKCLLDSPSSPDLILSGNHIFGSLKETMGGKTFRSEEKNVTGGGRAFNKQTKKNC